MAKKTPTTAPVFDLDAADVEYPPFSFKHKRKRHEIPNLFTLSPTQIELLDGINSVDSLVEFFRGTDGFDDLADLILEIPASKGFVLMKAWREFSTTTAESSMALGGDEDGDGEGGKGSTSSPSSAPNRAARRSKPTSRSGASASGTSRSGSRKRS